MKVHHTIDGDGPRTLVLANAIGTTTTLWEDQIPKLSESFRVVRWDIRGHGLTPLAVGVHTVADVARDVIELLDDLRVERVSLAGISLGGCVGVWLAVNAPERVESLILACTSATFGPSQAWIDRAAKVRAAGTEAIADWSMPRWFAAATRDDRPAAVERFHAALCAISDEGYAGCCEALAAWDATDQLVEVAAPTLVIAGADDPATPPADVQVVADGIPGATMYVIPGAAHLANVDRPRTFTDLMLGHLSKERVYE
jgi:3-oxoadipate enol-lactonase